MKWEYSKIDIEDAGCFSNLVIDHMRNASSIRDWVNISPDMDGLNQAIEHKKAFPKENREVLHKVLLDQYAECEMEKYDALEKNINLIQNSTTYTITTGHQLNLATGPLYFIYKIAHVIALAKAMKKKNPKLDFVPLYWMATEDHDLEEIDHFHSRKGKFKWNAKSGGAVGRIIIEDTAWIEEFKSAFPNGKAAERWIGLLKKSYQKGLNLSQATRILVQNIFKDYGLLILDADDSRLKTLFKPAIKKELESSFIEKAVESYDPLKKNYFKQVNARAINMFYLTDESRYRFERNESGIEAIDLKEEPLAYWMAELEEHPERFSPNVLMRPLYQECILPNIAYVGGGAEVAYWLELPEAFKAADIPFPSLWLRRSALYLDSNQARKAGKLNIDITDLLKDASQVFHQRIKSDSGLNESLDQAYASLDEIFVAVRKLAGNTDPSFIGAVDAQEAKQLKGYRNLQRRLLKAEKRKNWDIQERLILFYEDMNAGGSLQERKLNAGDLMVLWGKSWIDDLIYRMDPFDHQFTVVKEI